MSNMEQSVVEALVTKALGLAESARGELERSCWMVVHEHLHGVMPTEYDIREIDEQLYLKVLEDSYKKSKEIDTSSVQDNHHKNINEA